MEDLILSCPLSVLLIADAVLTVGVVFFIVNTHGGN
jgi:hypothetical protein